MFEIERLSFSYGGSRILWDIDLQIEPGAIVCLMGRNGVGKSTLLKNAVGLLEPSNGTVRIDGTPVNGRPPSWRARKGLAYVPQGREIFPHLTVEENLLLPLFAMKSRRSAAEALDEAMDIFPALRSLLRRKGGLLSGGQQQQLAIARALVTQPRILLLDEPTEGIQPSIVQEIGHTLQALKRRMSLAILLVEQCVPFARRVADSFVLMQKGRVVSRGPISGLTDELVSEYLNV
ncbi:MAG: urea ABC transporter ATP-binding subunit UrtE [Kiritimatiellae bacterium]|nr:urea ABC transporter ATP-binding subunit UrtE [Kiritimatiellia bacterium]